MKELARKKKQKREKEAKSAAAAAPEKGSESDQKPLGAAQRPSSSAMLLSPRG